MKRVSGYVGPVSGTVSVIAVMVGNGLALAGQAGATAGPGLVADLRHQSFVNSFGVTLEMAGWAALMCFIGYLFTTLRRVEPPDGWWSPVALAAGVLLVALKLGSVAPLMAAWSRRDDLTIPVAQTLSDLGGALFVVSGWATGLFVATAAASAVESRVLPGWLGWFGVLSGLGALVAGTAGVLDPVGYVPIPFLASLLWVLLTSVVLTARMGRADTVIMNPRATPDGVVAGR